MPRLIHLNGPPGIGKSTLAALYADRHPGTLDLDIDRLHALVGGWRDPDNRTHDVLRPVALAMASAHLGGGRDVILPQYLGRIAEIEAFERVARQHGADFHEVVLFDDKDAALDRFEHRIDDSDWERHNRRVVEAMGGRALLADLYDRLIELLQRRPSAIVVPSGRDRVEAAYEALIRALDDAASGTTPSG